MDLTSKKLGLFVNKGVSKKETIQKVKMQPFNALLRMQLLQQEPSDDNIINASIFNNRLVSSAPDKRLDFQSSQPLKVSTSNVGIDIQSPVTGNDVETSKQIENVDSISQPSNETFDNLPSTEVVVERTIGEPQYTAVKKGDVNLEHVEVEHKKETKRRKTKKRKKSNKKKIKQPFLLKNPGNLSEFNDWLLRLKPLKESNVQAILKKKKKKEKSKVELSAKESITRKKYIASEPLAKILVSQGHILEAIEMYKQISLIYPQKSLYFATQIEKLKREYK